MFEKMVKNKEELNAVAVHLRSIQNFDELWHLAEEWLVPEQDVEDFISGKRYRFAEIKIEDKEFSTAEEKLREEMWIMKDKEYTDIVAQHLIKKCEEEPFSSLVLLAHKTLQKCLNHVMEKAFQFAEEKRKSQDETSGQQKQCMALALSHMQVYEWAEEYYALDDAAEEEKERKEAKKNLKAEREKAKQRIEQTARIQKKPEQPVKEEAQISLFDLMSGNSDVNKEKKNESV